MNFSIPSFGWSRKPNLANSLGVMSQKYQKNNEKINEPGDQGMRIAIRQQPIQAE
ncbi:hypothetical protein GCM10008013_48990 [Paenibacillus segetis]|uniref:Uncharacterized protein n=1 Tax=Paenibacillus segetis TaxID=1325360 RepID=A0ABQ1YVI0_9BACL|nr:hypothetical protein GCM10008013_48990 [Paenibacillus segetis]